MFGDTAPKQNVAVLLDATKMRQIRSDYETKLACQGLLWFRGLRNYAPSMVDVVDGMVGYPQSNVAIMQVKKIDKLAANKTIGVKLSATDEDSDNVLHVRMISSTKDFQKLSLDPACAISTSRLKPEVLEVPPGASGQLPLAK